MGLFYKFTCSFYRMWSKSKEMLILNDSFFFFYNVRAYFKNPDLQMHPKALTPWIHALQVSSFKFCISVKCVLSYSLYSISEHHKRSAIDAGQIRTTVCSSDLKVSTSAGDTAVLWFQPGRTNVWAQEGSHRLGGAKSSHTHRICKDFNNEPLSPNHGDRSGVNKGPVHMQIRPRAVAIKQQPPVWAGRTHSLWH